MIDKVEINNLLDMYAKNNYHLGSIQRAYYDFHSHSNSSESELKRREINDVKEQINIIRGKIEMFITVN